MNEMSPRSDAVLTWAGIGWFVRALGWCLLGVVLQPASWVYDVAVRRAENAVRHAEACFERRAEAKHVRSGRP